MRALHRSTSCHRGKDRPVEGQKPVPAGEVAQPLLSVAAPPQNGGEGKENEAQGHHPLPGGPQHRGEGPGGEGDPQAGAGDLAALELAESLLRHVHSAHQDDQGGDGAHQEGETNTSKMPHIPCLAGWSTRAAPWAMAEVPSPASLVNTPRATPWRRAADRA